MTIRPPCLRWRTKACVMNITARTLTSITLLYSSTVISSSEVAADPSPALFTRMSRVLVLNEASVVATMCSGAERSRLSAWIASALDPKASTALTRDSACAFDDCETYVNDTYYVSAGPCLRLRLTEHTFAPAVASAKTMPLPMPRAPPVTIAILLFSDISALLIS